MIYEIHITGHLPEGWSDWFAGLEIRNEPGGETVLTGPLPDQAALIGLLSRIQAWNMNLVSVGVSRERARTETPLESAGRFADREPESQRAESRE